MHLEAGKVYTKFISPGKSDAEKKCRAEILGQLCVLILQM